MKEDVRPVIRGTAAWALGKIGNDEVLPILEQLKEKEQDEEAKQEFEKGIALLVKS